MSLERAKVNCERCYGLARNSDSRDICRLNSDQLYSARNEAMRALEDEVRDTCIGYKVIDKLLETGKVEDLENSAIIVARRIKVATCSLSACANCDYSSPKIVNMVREA